MAPRFKNILVKFIYLGGVTSANIIFGLDPQELDRLLLSAKTACPKLGALANAASFARNSCIGGRVLTANGLGVRLCQLAAALPTHVGHLGDRFGCSGRGLAAPQITPKKIFGPIWTAQEVAGVWTTEQWAHRNVTPHGEISRYTITSMSLNRGAIKNCARRRLHGILNFDRLPILIGGP